MNEHTNIFRQFHKKQTPETCQMKYYNKRERKKKTKKQREEQEEEEGERDRLKNILNKDYKMNCECVRFKLDDQFESSA